MRRPMQHTITVLVENKPGVLARVSGLFARRGFNIESLAVSITDDPTVSRMTIVVTGDDSTLEPDQQADLEADRRHQRHRLQRDSHRRARACSDQGQGRGRRARRRSCRSWTSSARRSSTSRDTSFTIEVTGGIDKVDAIENLLTAVWDHGDRAHGQDRDGARRAYGDELTMRRSGFRICSAADLIAGPIRSGWPGSVHGRNPETAVCGYEATDRSDAVERVLLFLAVAGPLVGLIFGALVGAHEKCAARRVIAGVLLGGIGPLVYGMWRLYGVITSALGLDSVANLCLQLVMFAVLGAILGIAILKYRSEETAGRSNPDELNFENGERNASESVLRC